MVTLIKTRTGKKVHLTFDGMHLFSRCNARFYAKGVEEVFGEIRKHDLCCLCFKGMAPENFDIDMTDRKFIR